MRNKIKRLEERVKIYNDEIEKLALSVMQAEKERKIVTDDREKLKKNVVKLL